MSTLGIIMTSKQTPGQRIREARELLRPILATKELDVLAGLAPGHTWILERDGGSNMASSTLFAIARVLGVSPEYLYRGEGRKPSAKTICAAVTKARFERLRSKETAA